MLESIGTKIIFVLGLVVIGAVLFQITQLVVNQKNKGNAKEESLMITDLVLSSKPIVETGSTFDILSLSGNGLKKLSAGKAISSNGIVYEATNAINGNLNGLKLTMSDNNKTSSLPLSVLCKVTIQNIINSMSPIPVNYLFKFSSNIGGNFPSFTKASAGSVLNSGCDSRISSFSLSFAW